VLTEQQSPIKKSPPPLSQSSVETPILVNMPSQPPPPPLARGAARISLISAPADGIAPAVLLEADGAQVRRPDALNIPFSAFPFYLFQLAVNGDAWK
jgi:hypothetical protein